jgi:hypothetical protein
MAQLTLTRQRCFHHPEREAAARCTKCSRYFCRECVVEYDNRLVCAVCLERLGKSTRQERPRSSGIFAASAGFFLTWAIFYVLGWILATLPSFGDPGIWGNG